MPTFGHGIGSKLYLSGFDISAFFKSYNIQGQKGTAETSTLADTFQQFVSGLGGANVTLDGFYDNSAGGAVVLLEAAFGSTVKVFTVYPQGATLGKLGYGQSGFATSLDAQADIGSAVSINGSLLSNTGFDMGVSLITPASITSAGNGTSIDQAAATANGARAYLHVTAFSGTDATIVVADSADDSSFATIGTFTQITAVNAAQRIAISGAVRRYVRYTISGTFTSVTFTLLFARK